MKKKRERKLPVKAEKEKKKIRYLSTCVIIAHCFLPPPPRPAPVGTLYSLKESSFSFSLPSECEVHMYICPLFSQYSFTVMFLFQIGCLLHFKVVWGYIKI